MAMGLSTHCNAVFAAACILNCSQHIHTRKLDNAFNSPLFRRIKRVVISFNATSALDVFMGDDVSNPLSRVFSTPIDVASFGLDPSNVFFGFSGATGSPPQLMKMNIYNWKVHPTFAILILGRSARICSTVSENIMRCRLTR